MLLKVVFCLDLCYNLLCIFLFVLVIVQCFMHNAINRGLAYTGQWPFLSSHQLHLHGSYFTVFFYLLFTVYVIYIICLFSFIIIHVICTDVK